jgi:hypothetical protein
MMWRIGKMFLVLASAAGLASAVVYAQAQTQPKAQTQAPSSSQAPPQQKQDPDRPGPTCAKILQMTSAAWIANITAIDDSFVDGQLRGIRIYGDCYDARTKRLAAALSKAGKGPAKAARDDFKDFETAIKDYTGKALAATDPPADAVKTAYSSLYEKQFRYAFYQGYEQTREVKNSTSPTPSTSASKAATHASAATSLAETAPKTSVPATTDDSSKAASSDADDTTKAKNRFGELLNALPEDKLHALHAAFGQIVGSHPTSGATELAVYRYAIFVLEPFTSQNTLTAKPLAKPFSAPPF